MYGELQALTGLPDIPALTAGTPGVHGRLQLHVKQGRGWRSSFDPVEEVIS